MDHCDECGFNYADYSTKVVATELFQLGVRYSSRLRIPVNDSKAREFLSRRPDQDTWSAIEYGCHLRDVLIAQRERLFLTLATDRPSFASIFLDQRAVLARYSAQTPEQVARDIECAAGMISWAFSGLDDSAWWRPCIYNYPEPAERNVIWLAQHTLHEGEHHLLDFDRVIALNSLAQGDT